MSNNPIYGFVALLVVGLLALVLRWAFGTKRSARGPLVNASESKALGLLSVVASKLDKQRAMESRAKLGEAGIRSSMSKRSDGLLDVLVFHGDVEAARRLLES